MNKYCELFFELPIVHTDEGLEAQKKKFKQYDPLFVTKGCHEQHRKFWEKLWKSFYPYADDHFYKEIKIHFCQRSWEIYIGNVLLNKNFFIKSDNQGPDFIIKDKADNDKAYIECIAPEKGNTHNRVPDVESNKMVKYPCPEICLRISSAFEEKANKYRIWREKGSIRNDIPYIIAISTTCFDYVDDDNLPNCIHVLYGASHIAVSLDNGECVLKYQDTLMKENHEKNTSTPVPIAYFCSQKYEHISAVIFSYDQPEVNNLTMSNEDCFLAVNPYAKNPLPDDIISQFTRYILEKEEEKIFLHKIERKQTG